MPVKGICHAFQFGVFTVFSRLGIIFIELARIKQKEIVP